MSQFFEIVIFTASHSCYANTILNILDPQNEFITYRMFRESCIETEEGIFVKDLRIFANRNIGEIFIVDNACYSYAFQMSNGIPIIPFFFEENDTQLIELSNFLLSLVNISET
jgi:CTD small phosphatase-like protein 2